MFRKCRSSHIDRKTQNKTKRVWNVSQSIVDYVRYFFLYWIELLTNVITILIKQVKRYGVYICLSLLCFRYYGFSVSKV